MTGKVLIIGIAAAGLGAGFVIASRLNDAAIATIASILCGAVLSVPLGLAILALARGGGGATVREPEPEPEPEPPIAYWTIVTPRALPAPRRDD